MNFFQLFAISFSITFFGTIPFGLVNLSVLEVSYHHGKNKALNVAIGAVIIEFIYAFLALNAGVFLGKHLGTEKSWHILVMLVLGTVGIYYFFKKNSLNNVKETRQPGVIKGMVLNLISLQVLVIWILIMTYISAYFKFPHTLSAVIYFIIGAGCGKLITLWAYACLSEKILGKYSFIADNINRIIGVVLLITVVVQYFRIF
ncbi:MAG: hypothetical protein JXA77_09565 [Bacteroidales bacterium]|nr:hypothetical protein [Bacteroidales bacterium]MBN2817417.1 hypothetical protein [Bacteroidales bacterium]